MDLIVADSKLLQINLKLDFATGLCDGSGCRLYEYYDPLAVLWLKWMLRVGLWCVFSWLNLPRHGSCEVQGITVTG